MKEIEAFLAQNDRFAGHCGIELLEAAAGFARAKMPLQPWHFNAAGTVHGGAIFTLADFAFAVAVNAGGTLALAIDTHLTFMKAVSEGVLEAEAREVSANRRLATYQVRITAGEELVALFQGTAYRKEGRTPVQGFQTTGSK
ncbi:acyl-CoA thioesterase [Geothermobacter ehrlichii]|uniref:Acyl-CoA thioesterase n=1 Tax=Geothermobacter ehrlichii TaxID=213224 RepID=A0A5D3WN35_9BACT|nr:PaaI family thioesterase [Geothermobacter ehrlichii]TYO99981.1 acyl-CoA thioesterase [Geothermobacter ehrlichii]